MGRIIKGAVGGFSGKAGSLVGSSWNGIDYIKGLSKISNKPASLKQLEQRLRFATVARFLGPLGELLKVGWKGQTTDRNTPVNIAVQYALAESLIGVYPNFLIDPSLVLLSMGTLGGLIDLNIQSTVAGRLDFTWDFTPGDNNRLIDDAVTVVVYNPMQETFLTYTATAIRNEMALTLTLPVNFATQQIHVYVFCVRRDDARRSKSMYRGPITLA